MNRTSPERLARAGYQGHFFSSFKSDSSIFDHASGISMMIQIDDNSICQGSWVRY